MESRNENHEIFADLLLTQCLDTKRRSVRIGITGTPGVGKSTFIESLGLHLIKRGSSIAVLTIDPSSPENQGSILGDKSRMHDLSKNPKAYVRSSPSRSALGGATDRTRETIRLCEAAGYDYIIIETVGVGQSEIEIAHMVDLVTLLMLPGSGDEIQGIKRGIVEVADIIVINKSDKFPKSVVKESKNSYSFATHLRPQINDKISVKVLIASGLKGDGMDQYIDHITESITFLKQNEHFAQNRNQQLLRWLNQQIKVKAIRKVESELGLIPQLNQLENDIINMKKTVNQVSEEIINKIFA